MGNGQLDEPHVFITPCSPQHEVAGHILGYSELELARSDYGEQNMLRGVLLF